LYLAVREVSLRTPAGIVLVGIVAGSVVIPQLWGGQRPPSRVERGPTATG
jgi:hypothetical protein